MALLELFAGAAGAGIVAADLGRFAAHRLGLGDDHAGVDPAPVLADEAGLLDVFALLAGGLETSDEVDGAFLIVFAAALGAGDLESEPLGRFSPLASIFLAEIRLLLRAERTAEVEIVALRIRRVAGTHQSLGRGGGRAGEDGTAALVERLAGAAGAEIGDGRRDCLGHGTSIRASGWRFGNNGSRFAVNLG